MSDIINFAIDNGSELIAIGTVALIVTNAYLGRWKSAIVSAVGFGLAFLVN